MDARTQKLVSAIDAYLEETSNVPEPLVAQLHEMKEIVEAPRYSQESPGEAATRRVAEDTMPEDVYNERYGPDEFNASETAISGHT